MNIGHSLLIIAVTAISTLATRATPFILFSGKKRRVPNFIIYLSNLLPPAVMAILVVYALKELTFSSIEGYFPSLCAVVVTVVLHLIKRNTLLSIFGGVAVNMILVQHFHL